MRDTQSISIVIADDDEEDRMLAKEAFEEAHLMNELQFVEDGEQLLELLERRGRYADQHVRRPGLILLDLNMPRLDGREALSHIKSDPDLRNIPVVILTTSQSEEDVLRSYNLGVNSFIVKPVSFPGLVEVMRKLSDYWFKIVRLPQ